MHFGLLLQSVLCSFLDMEGGLTHIEGLSDNVGMFYPKNKSAPSIDAQWSPGELGCYERLLV